MWQQILRTSRGVTASLDLDKEVVAEGTAFTAATKMPKAILSANARTIIGTK
jgi:hypothetical protein